MKRASTKTILKKVVKFQINWTWIADTHGCLEGSDIFVLVVGERNRFCTLEFSLIRFHQCTIDFNFSRGKSGSSDKFQSWIANQFPCQPKERFLEIVIRFGGDFEVLKVFLAVERNTPSFYFAFLDINLVTTKNNRNVFANSFEIAMPVGNVLVGDTRCDIKHDDTALALDIITISEATKFLLTSGIPYVKADCAKVGGEVKRMDLYTKSGDILLLEFTGQVTLYKGSLPSATIANKDELESRNTRISHGCM